ncbi:hypothetical protein M9H77_04167 [Catharanthus roseus]|uniref:Uncharacterized protein n=1 Tax=Catharanthus roseus TaxID=4058 RepID=A0ACC0CDC0_CATRO|nr:hypothetical protein M9H77_04167 [Catharanthus roseus]
MWMVSDFGRWIHLREGIIPWRVSPEQYYVRHCTKIYDRMATLCRVKRDLKLRLYPWSPTFALHVLLNLGVKAALMCLDSLRLPSCLTQIEQWHSKPLKFYAWSFKIGSFSEELCKTRYDMKVNSYPFKMLCFGISLENAKPAANEPSRSQKILVSAQFELGLTELGSNLSSLK